MIKPRTQIKGYYLDLPYESNEELYFLYWCEELIKKGIIASVNRGKTFVLSEAVKQEYQVEKQLKNSIKIVTKSKTLLRDHVYSNDFNVYFRQDKTHLFNFEYCGSKTINNVDYTTAYFEIKPIYDQNNMTRLFSINQKWVFDKYGQFINLFVPEKVFTNTFFPKKYLFKKNGHARNTNFLKNQIKIKLIDAFLSNNS
jgi:hypothetical protein